MLFRSQGVDADRLRAWCEVLGWETVLNRRGTTWRRLDAAEQGAVTDLPSACALMRSHPSAIRRPVVEWADGAVSVGFSAEDWARRA